MLRILIIEDSLPQAEALRMILELEGFHVEVAHHGQEAMELLRSKPFDLALSDVLMPDLSGYDLCRQVKSNPQTKNIPVVLLTQLTDPMDILQGLECGADNFITKPYDPHYLVNRIRSILSNRPLLGMAETGTSLAFRGRGVTITTNKEQILDLLFATVEESVRARNREREAQAAKEALEKESMALTENSRRKDHYLKVLAHELRNPMAPLLACVHVLRQPDAGPAAREQCLDRMDRQLRHLSRLLDDLLDTSKLSEGKVSLQRERIDLARLVRTTADDQRSVPAWGQLTLSVYTPETPVWVEGDRVRLAQVLVNLLENAAKFTERGGRVTVRLTGNPETQQATMTVEDTGVGISPEILPLLFDTFVQADKSLDHSQGGLGLGLATVKRLVELHQGRVEAASAGWGQGAAFTVHLPMKEEPPALSSLPKNPSAEGRRVRVLLIEDNPDAAVSLSMLLELLGHEVRVTYTGLDGVAEAMLWAPEVVISDIGLPGVDGYEVARQLRRNASTRSALLVALTGYGADEDRRQSREAGFDHHLVKPADPSDLQHLLLRRRPKAWD